MKQLVIGNYIITTPIKDILYELKQVCNGTKLKEIRSKGDNIQVTCPFHADGNESNPSCGIYIGDKSAEYGTFNCFTCGKHGSFVYFVALCLNNSIDYAEKWLISHFGVRNTEIDTRLEDLDFTLPKKNQVEYLDEAILDTFQSYHPYMDTRKLSKAVCEKFKVKYDPVSESLVFPVWETIGKLWMLTRRSVKNKTFIIDKDKEKPVYLMNVILERNLEEITVCESQINALTLWGWGIPAVATFGCNVTSKQMYTFNHSGLRHVYMAYDGDKAGRKGIAKFLKNIHKGIMVDIICLPPGRDVNDLTEDEFNSLPIISSSEWLSQKG